MAQLDYGYISRLAVQAQGGNADAFGELYASTYQNQYRFSASFLGDPALAREALQETYTTALKSLCTLSDPRVFVSWLSQINFRTCYRLSIRQASPEQQTAVIDFREYNLQQIMALPFSESQAIFLRHFRRMPVRSIAELMEIRPGSVLSYLSSGKKRLSRLQYTTERSGRP